MKTFGSKALGALLIMAVLAGIGAFGTADVMATPATADRNTQLKVSVEIKAYPVAATTDIFGGTLVCLTTAGYAVPCADTASYIAVGVAEGRADNNPGSAGDIKVRVRSGVALLNASSITQAMVGSMMYVVDDNVVDDGVGTNGISVGPLLEYVSTTSGWVWVGPQQLPNIKVTPSKLLAGVGAGYRIARGVTALDGGNPTPAATGLTTIVACTTSIVGTASPDVGTSVITVNINGTSIDLYAWKVTNSSTTSLVASTGTENIHWICVGT
jgi:hypothetical protein